MLNKKQILKWKPSLTEVEVKDWGGSVYMRQLSAAQVLHIQTIEEDRALLMQTLALSSIVNDDGSPMFEDCDKQFLADQPASVYNDLVAGFLKANHLNVGSYEEIKKNSDDVEPVEPHIEFLS